MRKLYQPLFRLIVAAFLLCASGGWNCARAGISPQRILVIYNAGDTRDDDGDGTPDSLQVARYYAAQRGVPLQ